MKQATFDNLFKVVILVMVGYFIFMVTKPYRSREGRFKAIDASNASDVLILDSETGDLYDGNDKKVR